jgi:iron(III) transport system substrate-binding protein
VTRAAFRAIWAIALLLQATAARAAGTIPEGYPASYAGIVDAARREGQVVIYSVTDLPAAAPLIRDFQKLYPGVRVDYRDMNSNDVYHRFLAETAAGEPSADVLWSSAMDQQAKLVNDGNALSYRSPEAAALPAWAAWHDEAYGTTFEPIVFAYNRRAVSAEEVPQSHADLAGRLTQRQQKFRGKVATFDIESSEVGYLFATQDARINPHFWDNTRMLGALGLDVYNATTKILDRLAAGEDLFAYNVIGSYALARARVDPALGVVLPQDYTLVLSRVAFIARQARHPNAARLWLDYLLSRRGQTVIANESQLFAVRGDVEGRTTAAELSRELGSRLKPIPVGTSLLANLDRATREDFLRRWRGALGR